MWRRLISLLLVVHGLIHLLGFAVYWKLADVEDLAYPTALLDGRLDASTPLVRALGALWLVAAIGFVVGASGLELGRAWWRPIVAATALLSLALCALGAPDAQVGVVVDAAILAALAVGRWLSPIAPRHRPDRATG